jgi:uncharacterized protein (DUF1501 family)
LQPGFCLGNRVFGVAKNPVSKAETGLEERTMVSRRDFLRSSSLVALAPTVPGFLANTARAAPAQKDARVLVVIQLDGGNDGINTVVPYEDEGYAKHRQALRLNSDDLIKVNDNVGLHPSMRDAGKLLEAGQLGIVPGVSYPNPNRSHFQSMAIWHSARLDPEEHGGLGWLGRALDELEKPADGRPSTLPSPGVATPGLKTISSPPHDARRALSSLLVGAGPPPVALRGRRSVASALERLDDFTLDTSDDPRLALSSARRGSPDPAETADRRPPLSRTTHDDLTAFVERSMLDAYATADRLADVTRVKDNSRYPDTALGGHLQLIARLLKAGFGTRVYYTVQGGYDTHAAQLQTHSRLLFELSSAVKAFLDDLTAAKLAERVAILAFSEFGRTVSENASAGTDHGTSGPVLLAGPRVRAGLIGAMPSLLDLDPTHGDLRVAVDFRRVYATVLADWLGLPTTAALGGAFEPLPLFRA